MTIGWSEYLPFKNAIYNCETSIENLPDVSLVLLVTYTLLHSKIFKKYK